MFALLLSFFIIGIVYRVTFLLPQFRLIPSFQHFSQYAHIFGFFRPSLHFVPLISMTKTFSIFFYRSEIGSSLYHFLPFHSFLFSPINCVSFDLSFLTFTTFSPLFCNFSGVSFFGFCFVFYYI